MLSVEFKTLCKCHSFDPEVDRGGVHIIILLFHLEQASGRWDVLLGFRGKPPVFTGSLRPVVTDKCDANEGDDILDPR